MVISGSLWLESGSVHRPDNSEYRVLFGYSSPATIVTALLFPEFWLFLGVLGATALVSVSVASLGPQFWNRKE